jgi:cytosine deaminase
MLGIACGRQILPSQARKHVRGNDMADAVGWIRNARVPACLLEGVEVEAVDGLARVDIRLEDGRIAAVRSASEAANTDRALDLDGGMVWPGFVDCHTHLDKSHIWPRAENPDGTFDAAVAAAWRDRESRWSVEDAAARMDFSVRCALAHGTVAIRTHLDSFPPHHRAVWQVFSDVRERWRGRIDLQPVAIVTPDAFESPHGEEVADLVADHDGVLGAVTSMVPGLEQILERVFALAAERRLDLDLHVDESLDPGAKSLRMIADARLRTGFEGRVLCGHCCSLAVQDDAEVAETIARVRAADLAVVSLPLCNLYLQDRRPGRTPRARGMTLVHELATAGVPVALASDNIRDPFYGYGDLDMLEVFREAVRIGHLDRPIGGWPAATSRTPAAIMGLERRGVIAAGTPADMVLFKARDWSELLSRPQSDRILLHAGRRIDIALPDYRELDRLLPL